MKIEDKEGYILINSEGNSFDVFFKKFEKEHTNFEENHLIVHISPEINSNEKNISLFLSYADLHQQNGTSFVLICQNVDVDVFPETFNIVPTLVEAEDVIEMENIQRDLGF
ncbi:hypothetical protein WH52_05345 [Tenacibaculum holothuriorum]|uniref:Uncharacterized protein n=1 Tax=Tenacibaculum holothuriorum TaxID=1635173 RepID=A0A1Y2PDG5_9FLAO|nr:hypothetical protein [Tenacibaculum holothuriorum]OSY88210.1 hypothetical protein WH52_05345 [Tenacibaculum holothuriorum]